MPARPGASLARALPVAGRLLAAAAQRTKLVLVPRAAFAFGWKGMKTSRPWFVPLRTDEGWDGGDERRGESEVLAASVYGEETNGLLLRFFPFSEMDSQPK